MHSYLPAHIPYNSLVSAYASSTEEHQRKLLQVCMCVCVLTTAGAVGIANKKILFKKIV